MYSYRKDVLEMLRGHGVNPTPDTPPQIAYDFVHALYRYELRVLRDRLVKRQIPKEGYIDRVVALRRKYPVVSLKVHELLEADAGSL